MNIKELREQAIKRYENGESLMEIYQSLGKVRTLFLNSLGILYVIEKLTENKNCKQQNTPNILPKSSIDLSRFDLWSSRCLDTLSSLGVRDVYVFNR